MCYAIPGKIVAIQDNTVTVEYFGEQKRAKNDFFQLSCGEYVYAQGGFVVQKMSELDALPILESWKELFFQLQETDARLSRNPGSLYQRANYIRQKHLGNACCVHGIIEFSNYCANDCFYCGIRVSNDKLPRYRMPVEEIIATAKSSVRELGFKALVLQSGEDTWYDAEKLSGIVEEMRKLEILVILSIGEREFAVYKKLYQAGARAALLRFETSNPTLYATMRPGHNLEDRIALINKLRGIGFLIMTGFLVGLPGQSAEDLMQDINLTGSLGTDMFSFGPFIPHPATPLAEEKLPSLDAVLKAIAHTRIMFPESKILATTALGALDKDGIRFGLLSGANSLMINLTPKKYQPLYEIYPGHALKDADVKGQVEEIVHLLHSLGRAPTDLGL
jgi:biotin synthase